MSIYIYCPRKSEGAFELVKALPATRLRKFDGMDFWDKGKKFSLSPGDVVICWGSSVPDLEGVKVLNSLDAPVNKLQELINLRNGGVSTVKCAAARGQLLGTVLGRNIYHQGGTDLLNQNGNDFFVVKENFVNEYRIHSFDRKSIRAGVKVPRNGFTPIQNPNDWKPNANLAHPWIRSYDGGWRVRYEGFASTPAMKALAHRAVATLGLTFGAVDMGELPDGTLKVLEVNRAPGIEGGTIQSYVRAIKKWIEKEG